MTSMTLCSIGDGSKQRWAALPTISSKRKCTKFSSDTNRHRYICKQWQSTWICCSPYLPNVRRRTHSRNVFRLILMMPVSTETQDKKENRLHRQKTQIRKYALVSQFNYSNNSQLHSNNSKQCFVFYLVELHRAKDINPLRKQLVNVTEQVCVHWSTGGKNTKSTRMNNILY